MPTVLLASVVALIGLMIGSFLNVVIYRVPRKESVVAPRSRCPSCNTELRARDNIPVVSWLILRGRCRSCSNAISSRYPSVEVLTALLFAAIAVRFSDDPALPAFLFFVAVLVAVSAIDLEHYIVPNRIVIVALTVGLPLLAAIAVIDDRGADLRSALIGSVLASGGLFAMHLAYPRGMGMGDVKLALVLGLYLGWLGLGEVFVGMFLGFLLGSIVGLGLMAAGLRTRSQHLPFAPFLAAGSLLTVFIGDTLLNWYIR